MTNEEWKRKHPRKANGEFRKKDKKKKKRRYR